MTGKNAEAAAGVGTAVDVGLLQLPPLREALFETQEIFSGTSRGGGELGPPRDHRKGALT